MVDELHRGHLALVTDPGGHGQAGAAGRGTRPRAGQVGGEEGRRGGRGQPAQRAGRLQQGGGAAGGELVHRVMGDGDVAGLDLILQELAGGDGPGLGEGGGPAVGVRATEGPHHALEVPVEVALAVRDDQRRPAAVGLLELRGPLGELRPGGRAGAAEAGLLHQLGAEVHQVGRPGVRHAVVLAVVGVVLAQGVDEGLGLHPGRGPQLVERGGGLVEGEVEPGDVRGDDHVGQLTTGEGGVELLRQLLVVGTTVDEPGRGVRVGGVPGVDHLLLDGLRLARVVGPELERAVALLTGGGPGAAGGEGSHRGGGTGQGEETTTGEGHARSIPSVVDC
ncbi:hypothetical protein SDC9_66995 [bioreactor metagenome]|uniref:Uncharacterized protein n=1 Tax=bioreactor metagenome TaxID=1076179 RepID=A0A644Y340_9ZZZZ